MLDSNALGLPEVTRRTPYHSLTDRPAAHSSPAPQHDASATPTSTYESLSHDLSLMISLSCSYPSLTSCVQRVSESMFREYVLKDYLYSIITHI